MKSFKCEKHFTGKAFVWAVNALVILQVDCQIVICNCWFKKTCNFLFPAMVSVDIWTFESQRQFFFTDPMEPHQLYSRQVRLFCHPFSSQTVANEIQFTWSYILHRAAAEKRRQQKNIINTINTFIHSAFISFKWQEYIKKFVTL